jgi:hydroxyacylglutathione hydrolase
MTAHIHQFLCLKDNFGVLIHDPETSRTACVDAPEAAPILTALAEKGWDLTEILITHHHADHTQGIPALKAKYPKARVVGPNKEAAKIGALDLSLGEGDYVAVGSLTARVIEVPGHTSGHIAYHFEDEDVLFAGDTLFALGCGRPFEEPPRVLFHSLMKLARLRGETQVYCGHEYTLSNARFALAVDGGNAMVKARAAEVERLVAAGAFTLPTTIALERATNPFLRAEDEDLKEAVGMPDADEVDVFTYLRERKNRG